ncbi:RSC complex subunit Rsc58 [Schizosaccharomyces japonicus yFS275]|uniref:RSC complex subunit Rsc58 n=1 Tax=Schizosaccharomyces japonicus (strain yFS275 / FY16936) TaxID=402676 RepID=B6K2V9_SCHJY|nr:RSC complex subunit Rsc58 [Schizosaccharomyces japonicus yFS275]EEB08599.1 RSC complex subunit Rsc58 [Schizosaccharomyces japonicus yFS275]
MLNAKTVTNVLESTPAGQTILSLSVSNNQKSLREKLSENLYSSYLDLDAEFRQLCVAKIKQLSPEEPLYWQIDHLYLVLHKAFVVEANRSGQNQNQESDGAVAAALAPMSVPESTGIVNHDNGLPTKDTSSFSHALLMLTTAGPMFTSTAKLSSLDPRLPDGGKIAASTAVVPVDAKASPMDPKLRQVSPTYSFKPSNPVMPYQPTHIKLPSASRISSGPFQSFFPTKDQDASVVPEALFQSAVWHVQSAKYQSSSTNELLDVDFIRDNLHVLSDDVYADAPISQRLRELNSRLLQLNEMQAARLISAPLDSIPQAELQLTHSIEHDLADLVQTYELSPETVAQAGSIDLSFTAPGPLYQGTLPPVVPAAMDAAAIHMSNRALSAHPAMNYVWAQAPARASPDVHRRSGSKSRK